jgi:hypothetical protein
VREVTVPSTYSVDAAIQAQNAGATAATIYAALANVRGDTGFDAELYNEIRQEVFAGTIELSGIERFVEYFGSAPKRGGGNGGGGGRRSGGSADHAAANADKAPGDVVVPFGKHKGTTLGDLVETDADYVQWLAENAQFADIKAAARAALEAA